ncbi:MAG: hypothetical protein JWP03_555 [Phycisphaerales bacterium]|nr:hypothetical protein [Phycisphaerales bacterium]
MARVIESLKPTTAKRMVADASNRPTLAWVGVALVIHLVVMVATSLGYIRDHWIDPAGAGARAQAAAAAPEPPAQVVPASTSSAQSPVAPPQPAKAGTPADDEKALLEQRANNPEVKKLNEKAKPGEIPKDPQHQGFNLDDSSLK